MRSDSLGRASAQGHRHSVSTGQHLNSSAECALLHQVHTGVFVANEPLGTPQWLNVRPGQSFHSVDFGFYDHTVGLSNAAVTGPVEEYDYAGTWSPVGAVTVAQDVTYDFEYQDNSATHYLVRDGLTALVQWTPYAGYEQLREITGNYIHDPNGSPTTYALSDNGDTTGQSDGGHYWGFEPETGYFIWDTYTFAGTVYAEFQTSNFTWTATTAMTGTISGGHSYSYDVDAQELTVLWDSDSAKWYKMHINENDMTQMIAIEDYNNIYPQGTHMWTHQGTGFQTVTTTQATMNVTDRIVFQVVPGNAALWRQSTSTGTGDPVGSTTLYTDQGGNYDGEGTITFDDTTSWTGTATPSYGSPDPTLAPAEFHAEVHFRFAK